MMVKDISRFPNRNIKRSVLLDPKPLNFLITPENGLPCIEYNAEIEMPEGEKDPYLMTLIEEIEKIT